MTTRKVRSYIVACWCLLVLPTLTRAAPAPPWWTDSTLDWHSGNPSAAMTGLSHQDLNYAATQGQAMRLARYAKQEFDRSFGVLGGAGEEVNKLIDSFTQHSADSNKALHQIQLKQLAEPFYRRLQQIGYLNVMLPLWKETNKLTPNTYPLANHMALDWPYPWSEGRSDDKLTDIATVAQLKFVFSFDPRRDFDGDQMADWWELHYLGGTGNTAIQRLVSILSTGNVDGDSKNTLPYNNLAEFTGKTDPAFYDNAAVPTIRLGNSADGFSPYRRTVLPGQAYRLGTTPIEPVFPRIDTSGVHRTVSWVGQPGILYQLQERSLNRFEVGAIWSSWNKIGPETYGTGLDIRMESYVGNEIVIEAEDAYDLSVPTTPVGLPQSSIVLRKGSATPRWNIVAPTSTEPGHIGSVSSTTPTNLNVTATASLSLPSYLYGDWVVFARMMGGKLWFQELGLAEPSALTIGSNWGWIKCGNVKVENNAPIVFAIHTSGVKIDKIILRRRLLVNNPPTLSDPATPVGSPTINYAQGNMIQTGNAFTDKFIATEIVQLPATGADARGRIIRMDTPTRSYSSFKYTSLDTSRYFDKLEEPVDIATDLEGNRLILYKNGGYRHRASWEVETALSTSTLPDIVRLTASLNSLLDNKLNPESLFDRGIIPFAADFATTSREYRVVAYAIDHDNDGLFDHEEYGKSLNPFSMDTDGDGDTLPNGLNTLTDLLELQNGWNPNSVDTDLDQLSDLIDPMPLNSYNDQDVTFEIIDGSMQMFDPGEWSFRPLRVKVYSGSGPTATPLPFREVSFFTSPVLTLSENRVENGGDTKGYVSVRTDQRGIASISVRTELHNNTPISVHAFTMESLPKMKHVIFSLFPRKNPSKVLDFVSRWLDPTVGLTTNSTGKVTSWMDKANPSESIAAATEISPSDNPQVGADSKSVTFNGLNYLALNNFVAPSGELISITQGSAVDRASHGPNLSQLSVGTTSTQYYLLAGLETIDSNGGSTTPTEEPVSGRDIGTALTILEKQTTKPWIASGGVPTAYSGTETADYPDAKFDQAANLLYERLSSQNKSIANNWAGSKMARKMATKYGFANKAVKDGLGNYTGAILAWKTESNRQYESGGITYIAVVQANKYIYHLDDYSVTIPGSTPPNNGLQSVTFGVSLDAENYGIYARKADSFYPCIAAGGFLPTLNPTTQIRCLHFAFPSVSPGSVTVFPFSPSNLYGESNIPLEIGSLSNWRYLGALQDRSKGYRGDLFELIACRELTGTLRQDLHDYILERYPNAGPLPGFDSTLASEPDSLPDWWERKFFGSVTTQNGLSDSDGDSLTNSQEYGHNSSPTSRDTDMDGIIDSGELGTTTVINNGDTDKDGLSDGADPEALNAANGKVILPDGKLTVGLRFIDQTTADSDNDGLSDFLELFLLRTNPLENDTDGDGIDDSVEWASNGIISPLFADTNDDGLRDVSTVLPNDLDNDGLSRAVEAQWGTDPAKLDSDDDLLNDYQEIMIYGTDPLRSDSDGDGRTDYAEVTVTPKTNPLVRDSDGDGITDGAEITNGTSPLSVDSNFDGWVDGRTPSTLDGELTLLQQLVLGLNPTAADLPLIPNPSILELATPLKPIVP